MGVGDGVPFLGYDSAVCIAKQLTSTTFVTAGSFFEFNSESVKKEREEIKIESINNNRDYTKRLVGNETISGGVEFDLNPAEDGIVNIIKQALGGTCTSATVSAGATYTHTLRIGDMENNATAGATSMRGLSVGIRKGNTNTWQCSMMRVNELSISGEVGGPVVCSAEFVGMSETNHTSIGAAAVSFSTVAPVNFTGVKVEIGNTITSLTEEYFTGFEFTLNNNIDDSVRRLGSRNIVQSPPLKRDVMLKLSSRFDTMTSHNRFLDNTITAIQITCDSEQTISSGVTTHSMYIKLPNCRYNSNNPEVGDSGVLAYDVDITSLNDASLGSVQIVITNGTADYA